MFGSIRYAQVLTCTLNLGSTQMTQSLYDELIANLPASLAERLSVSVKIAADWGQACARVCAHTLRKHFHPQTIIMYRQICICIWASRELIMLLTLYLPNLSTKKSPSQLFSVIAGHFWRLSRKMPKKRHDCVRTNSFADIDKETSGRTGKNTPTRLAKLPIALNRSNFI